MLVAALEHRGEAGVETSEQYMQRSQLLVDTWERSEPWIEYPSNRQKAMSRAHDTFREMREITDAVLCLQERIAHAW